MTNNQDGLLIIINRHADVYILNILYTRINH